MKKYLFWVAVAVLAMTACVQQQPEEFSLSESGVLRGVTVNLPDAGAFQTRSTFVVDASGVHVLWAADDTLGILPNQGDQVYFPMSSGAGSSTARFDGGAWGVKDANTYSSYFPFSNKYYTAAHNAIRLSYTGQCQDGNGSVAHMGAFDYLASGAAAPHDNYLTLNLVRLGSIACFKVQVPVPGTYTSAVLNSDAGFTLTANLDVTGETPVVTPVTTANEITLSLKNLTTTEAGEEVTLYMMLSPVELTGHSLTLRLLGKGISCYVSLTPKDLLAGKPYMFQGGEMTEAIGFKDARVKEICVQHWDTDGNGEISYAEAAAVSSIGTYFKGSTITKFDELQYFTSLTSLAGNAFKGCSRLDTLVLPAGVTTLGNDVFSGCKQLKRMVLPEGLTLIPESAFYQCSAMTSINIPSTVTEIGGNAFDGCSSLTSLSLPAGLQTIGYCALRGLKKVTGISLPAGVTEPSCNMFDGWESLESFTIPSSWTTLPHCLFTGCRKLSSITIPEGVTWIGHSCFDGCSSLETVSFPSTLKYISSYAFQNCSSLDNVVIPAGCCGAPKDGYGNYCHFSGCTSLTSISLPSSWTLVGDDCFGGCTSLASITLPEGVSVLGDRCFQGCTSLTTVSLPHSLIGINGDCFRNCSSLEQLVIPAQIKTILNGTFAGCKKLSDLTLPEGLVSINSFYSDACGPFNGCTALKSLTLPETLRSIGEYGFFRSGLTSIVIPDGCASLGRCAFEGVPLESIQLPSSLSVMEIGLLYGTSLKSITIPAGVQVIRSVIPSSVTKITLNSTVPPAILPDLIPQNDCPIVVPGESLDAYRAAPVWSQYATRFQASSDTGAENPNPGGWE